MNEDAGQFGDWPERRQERDDGVGAFARRALADPATSGFGALIGCRVVRAADEELEASACEAIREYDAALPKRRAPPP